MIETITLTVTGLAFIYFGLSCFYIILKPEDKKSVTQYPKTRIRIYDGDDRTKGNLEINAYKIEDSYYVIPNLKDVEEVLEVAP